MADIAGSQNEAQAGATSAEAQLLMPPDPMRDPAFDEAQAKSDQALLERARKNFERAADAERENRKHGLDDINFSLGDQWPADIKTEREADARPCLTINKLPQFISQISNDQRQNRPSIKVHPVSDGANVDTAEIIQGLVRHIENNSCADAAYDTGGEFAIRCGFGSWRVVTDFISPTSFDQEIYIKRIHNNFSVYMDPSHQNPDGSDAEWCHVIEDVLRDDYEDKWPDSELSGADGWEDLGNAPPDWMKSDRARVSEYFYKEYQDVLVHQLNTGESVMAADLAAHLQKAQAANIQAHVVRSRRTKIPKVKWIKMNGIEILERGEWAGKYIPIIPVYGSELFVDGKRILSGIVRHAKDAQRMLNFYKSAEAEAIALAPKAPFVGAEGQFEGHEEQWKTANRKNHAYLQYKPVSLNGQPAPPPQRMSVEPAVQAISQGALGSNDDVKGTIGIYDQSLGAGPADQSGVSIQKRNIQAQTTMFHYTDNQNRSIRHTGVILVDLMPHIYDTARAARIIGEDGVQKLVRLNQEYQDENGQKLLYQLDVGTYDVTIDTGPSYASKRQETAAAMQEMCRAYPQLMQFAGDIMVGSMDWNRAQEIADRLRRMLPPQLQADGKGGPKIPPQVQAQMQQQAQQISQLAQMYHTAQDQLDQKKPEIESRERIEMAKLQTQSSIEIAKLNSKEGIALLEQEVGAIKHQHEMLMQQMQSLAQPQPSAPQAGSEGAQSDQDPTGGQSPGQPMEPQ